jgi:hypothetical protein
MKRKVKIIQLHYKYVFGRNVAYAKIVDAEDESNLLFTDALSRCMMQIKTDDVELINAQDVLHDLTVLFGSGA